MFDPWDVTGTRRSDQYVSCMKINGVPLLPPVLSSECRKEMQYYKALALEVEKRISALNKFVENLEPDDSDKLKKKKLDVDLSDEDYIVNTEDPGLADECDSLHSCETVKGSNSSSNLNSPKLVIGVSDIFKDKLVKYDNCEVEKPERDYDCLVNHKKSNSEGSDDKYNVNKNKNFTPLSSPKRIGRSSSLCTSRSFDDIHAEFSTAPQLARQQSYTILKPGPALLAHLEVQSLKVGVEISSISMSESCSKLSQLSKKRRSWDLETAKEKWSNMALELNTNENVINKRIQSPRQNIQPRYTRSRSNSLTVEKPRTNITPLSPLNQKNISINKSPYSEMFSPTKTKSKCDTANVTPTGHKQNNVRCHKNDKSPGLINQNSYCILPSMSPATNEFATTQDPSSCIRELYDKIRQQQMFRMASLIEKQNREKQLLEQVFEEQNTLFYKQIKTVCPTSQNEVKEAWTGNSKQQSVSLCQITKTPSSNVNIEAASILNDSQSCLKKTQEVLKKCRRLRSSSISKERGMSEMLSPYAISSKPKSAQRDKSRTFVAVVSNRNPRTSESSSKSENEPMLTNRTDGTMADLNFTLTSDENGDYSQQFLQRNGTFILDNSATDKNYNSTESSLTSRRASLDKNTPGARSRTPKPVLHSPRRLENSERMTMRKLFADKTPTAEEIKAATRIVAHARGYLTRRLLRTERVQSIVQTIKDALVCAIQLHQDREGIRGADIDLHRRLIQQITAACYSLNDTFVESTPRQRCLLIAQDRERIRNMEEKLMSGSFTRPQSTPTRRSGRRNSNVQQL